MNDNDIHKIKVEFNELVPRGFVYIYALSPDLVRLRNGEPSCGFTPLKKDPEGDTWSCDFWMKAPESKMKCFKMENIGG